MEKELVSHLNLFWRGFYVVKYGGDSINRKGAVGVYGQCQLSGIIGGFLSHTLRKSVEEVCWESLLGKSENLLYSLMMQIRVEREKKDTIEPLKSNVLADNLYSNQVKLNRLWLRRELD